jgi:hypothetical protein
MAEQARIVRLQKLSEQGKEPDLKETTPVQRLEMMWQLALDAWTFKRRTRY